MVRVIRLIVLPNMFKTFIMALRLDKPVLISMKKVALTIVFL